MPPEPTIFVVDDDEAVRNSLEALLQSAGLRVVLYGSGLEFLEGYETCGQGCVLLDLEMPALSGLAVLEVLAAERRAIPAIVMTGHACAATQRRAMEAGALTVLKKPLHAQSLLDTIRTALRRRQCEP